MKTLWEIAGYKIISWPIEEIYTICNEQRTMNNEQWERSHKLSFFQILNVAAIKMYYYGHI